MLGPSGNKRSGRDIIIIKNTAFVLDTLLNCQSSTISMTKHSYPSSHTIANNLFHALLQKKNSVKVLLHNIKPKPIKTQHAHFQTKNLPNVTSILGFISKYTFFNLLSNFLTHSFVNFFALAKVPLQTMPSLFTHFVNFVFCAAE